MVMRFCRCAEMSGTDDRWDNHTADERGGSLYSTQGTEMVMVLHVYCLCALPLIYCARKWVALYLLAAVCALIVFTVQNPVFGNWIKRGFFKLIPSKNNGMQMSFGKTLATQHDSDKKPENV